MAANAATSLAARARVPAPTPAIRPLIESRSPVAQAAVADAEFRPLTVTRTEGLEAEEHALLAQAFADESVDAARDGIAAPGGLALLAGVVAGLGLPTRQRCARLPDRRWDACADLLWSGVVGRDHVALVSGVEAVLLDMDGTLVDPDGAIAHSSPAETTVRHCLPALGPVEVAESAARRLALQYDDLAGIAPTEGAQRLVAVLPHHAWRWAVVTAADRRLADARLAARRLVT
jgi:hypothetical protein